MTFREKAAWISILSMSGIYGLYFWSLKLGPLPGGWHFDGLLGTIVALVAVQVVLIVAVAIAAPNDAQAPRDERDRLIELRATRVGYSALASGIAVACFFGAFTPPLVFNANALLFILVAAEIVRSACQVILYRLSA